MRVLLPITLDRWRHAIATALRETSIRIPDINFYSFSDPAFEEDRVLGQAVWEAPNLHRVNSFATIKEPFDVVHHASSTNKNLMAAFVARLRSLGHCAHLFSAQVEPFIEDPWYRHYAMSLRMAHKVTAVSRVVADGVKRHFGRTVDAIIPNGVDLTFFSQESASDIDLDRLGIRRPFVVFTGVLEVRKRPDVFIAISKLVPEMDFVMVGGSYNTVERDFYLSSIGECPNIKYLGLQPRALVRDLYAQAVALVFPSDIEGLALAVVEAQAMGLPVLAQPRTSMPEVIQEGVTGWLLALDPLEEWSKKLKEILGWSNLKRANYSKASRSITATRYSWEVIAPMYRDIYLSTAERSK